IEESRATRYSRSHRARRSPTPERSRSVTRSRSPRRRNERLQSPRRNENAPRNSPRREERHVRYFPRRRSPRRNSPLLDITDDTLRLRKNVIRGLCRGESWISNCLQDWKSHQQWKSMMVRPTPSTT
ncbi:hypothetical protein A2U01_0054886, partial [Trifolium medium]|nr:hypothetical protein [Trifolium medium]